MTSRVFAIVPAAGRSRRMGTDKQLLDVGGRPMLAVVVDALLASRVAGVAVVTRRDISEQLGLADHAQAPPGAPGAPSLQRWGHESAAKLVIAHNEDPAAEMIDSIRIGLRAWRDRVALRDRDGLLVCPGDHPGITTADIDACIIVFGQQPERIVIATHNSRRGHPLIFPVSMTPFVESSECDGGLRALPHAHANRVQLVECASTGITRDIDTPGDYEALR